MWIIVGVAIIAFVSLIYFKQGGLVAQMNTVTLAQIPRVYEALQSTGQDGSWAGLIPPKLRPDDEEHLNVQFSIENGAIGFDWLLVSSINIRDRRKFTALLNSKRIPYREVEENGVSYLRIEDGRAASICQSVLEDMYGVTNRMGIEMIVEGFEWVPSDA